MTGTAITRKNLARLEDFVLSRPGTNGLATAWGVTTTITVPMFCGDVTEESITTQHGWYTTEFLFKPGYFVNGWIEAGYLLVPNSWDHEEWVGITFKMTNGPVKVLVCLQPLDSN